MNNCEILLGQKAFFNRTVFQACAAKTANYREARSTVQSMKLKFRNCTWAGIAYKIPTGEDFYEEIPTMGKKILTIMQRMEASNLTIGVSIWYSGNITNHDCNRMVLGRVIDIINYVYSLVPPEELQEIVQEVVEFIEPEPINSHDYLYFPDRPLPAEPPPYDYNTEKLRKRLKEIITLFDEAEARSLHELTFHTIVGKVLHMVFALLNTVPYTPARAKAFFSKENLLEVMNDFEPTSLKKRKIKEIKRLIAQYSYLDPSKIEKISHSTVLLLDYIKTLCDLLEEVKMPTAIEKPVFEESILEPEPKPLVYYPAKPPKKKKGKYLNAKEMIIAETLTVVPAKIAINLNNESDIDLSLRKLSRVPYSLSLERYSSLERGKMKKFGKLRTHNISTDLSDRSLHFSKQSIEISKKSFNLNKKSIEELQNFSKLSLGQSKNAISLSRKAIMNEDEFIDRVIAMLHPIPSV